MSVFELINMGMHIRIGEHKMDQESENCLECYLW